MSRQANRTRHLVGRRSFLRGAGGAAVLATGSGSFLAACGGNPEDEQRQAVEGFEAVKLPSFVEYTGVEADLEGTPGLIRPGFLKYPSDRPKATDRKPGKGSTFTGMANIYYPLPPGPDKSRYWQGLNERLGSTLEMIMVPNAEYNQKLATVIAGGDLPDFVQLTRGGDAPPNLPQLLEAKFADLTEFLSGDAIKEYPNLANIPERAWKACVYNGGIYGVPVPRDAVGGMPFVRADILKAHDLSLEPADFAEFEEIARTVTNPKQNRWAFALPDYPQSIVRTMLGAPNVWRNEGGTLTHVNESEADRQVLEIQARWWKEGLLHPDAFSDTVPFKEWFNAGTVVIAYDGYQGWTQYIQDNVHNPEFELDLMTIPGYDGGLGRIALGGSTFLNGLTAFKQAGKERLREQLRIADWLAAPFGTEEYYFRLYGEEGVHHKVDKNGDPRYTPLGLSETVIPIRYIAEGPSVIYQPGRPDDVRIQHEYESTVVPEGIPNPVLGLYSNTEATDGPTLDGKLTDLRNEVIRGRKTMRDWTEGLKEWRKGGYDQIRKEYQEQIQQRGK